MIEALKDWTWALPSPYDISMTGWTRVHSKEISIYDLENHSISDMFLKLWDEMKELGKKEFLERNGVLPEDCRGACIRFNVPNRARICIMAPIPQEVKVLFQLTFNEPESEWRL